MGKTTIRRRKYKHRNKLGNPSTACHRKTYEKIKKAFKKAQKEQKEITCNKILKILNCFPNFLGCFAQDTIDSLFLKSLPCIFLVNIDSSNKPGSHWIVLAAFDKTLEIFDPLGFKIYNWKSVPCNLLNFIHTESLSRQLLISPQIQSLSSNLCAFYCMYFVYQRHKKSFHHIISQFIDTDKNDELLFTRLSN